ncbi:centromere protein L [Paramormyrops kingsleyae]|uniref:Centromere protein L n=1 Tax=Paramormyrops kingsleyae TaxID=1676925 RepID=A0A3B3SCU6_9TELE|nr:centromere protein L [Paramormyrops kingsleyae]
MEAQKSATMTPRTNVASGRRSLGFEKTNLRYTPGQLTALRIPTSRRKPNTRNDIDPEQLAYIANIEWKLSYVTPLYKFRHTQLVLYSKQLSAFIVAEKQKGIAVEVGPEMGFKVVFSVVLGMTETDEDAETVFIKICSKPAFAVEGSAVKVVWSGWFTCVNGNLDYMRSLPSDFVSLPLFCTNGPESITALVKSWFTRMFDCYFGPLSLNSSILQWLGALWTECHPASNIRYLKLAWNLPTLPPLDISYTVHPQDAWNLWSSIRQNDSMEDGISIEEVRRFMKGLESHFFRHFRMHLSAGMLTRICTSLGSAHCDGTIKITGTQYITPVLMLLTECAQLKMPI